MARWPRRTVCLPPELLDKINAWCETHPDDDGKLPPWSESIRQLIEDGLTYDEGKMIAPHPSDSGETREYLDAVDAIKADLQEGFETSKAFRDEIMARIKQAEINTFCNVAAVNVVVAGVLAVILCLIWGG